MDTERINPHKVTKPIQLLAAWLVGLVATNTLFLGSAAMLGPEGWERGGLVIASMVNVPLFLVALFVLQTRFRAELQEDHFYADYLSKKTDTLVKVGKNHLQEERISILEASIARFQQPPARVAGELDIAGMGGLDWSGWRVGLNLSHPRYPDIRGALRSAQIPLAELFGDAKRPPKLWLIALSNQLPTEHQVALLQLLLPFGFEGFQLWNPVREAGENEDVYIGSYGGEYVKVTPELHALLADEIEPIDLDYYYETNLCLQQVQSSATSQS
jgi:hypothetical protein